MRYRTLLFDLDGTLVDSLRDLTGAVNVARQAVGLGPLEEEAVRDFVGDGLTALLARTVPGQFQAVARSTFETHYTAHLLDHTRPYPGVAEMLAAVGEAGCRSAVVTNKPAAFSRRILEGLGLARHLGAILGGDGKTARKPSPEPFREALGILGGTPAQALMVGDGRNDVHGARAAGLRVCGVLYGMGRADEMRRLAPDYLIAAPAELLALLREPDRAAGGSRQGMGHEG